MVLIVRKIKQKIIKNTKFRNFTYADDNFQSVMMSLKPGEEIPRETHNVTQIFLIVQGWVTFTLRGPNDRSRRLETLRKGDFIIVPPHTEHKVTVMGNQDVKLITFYAPKEH